MTEKIVDWDVKPQPKQTKKYSVYHMTFQKSLLSPLKQTLFQQKYIVVTDIVMMLLVPAESVNTCVVIALFMT